MKTILATLFSIWSFVAFSQTNDQFRMVGSGTWTTINDSTYQATISFQSDLTGGGFLATQIVDTFRLFTGAEKIYRVDTVWNKTFSGATMRVVEYNGTNGIPSGQVMVYNPSGRATLPQVPAGSTGATAQLQAAVVTYNAKQAATGTVADDDYGDISVVANVWNIDANTVGNNEMANNAIGTDEIIDASIATADIANDAITAAKIATNAVGFLEIADESVGAADIDTSAVSTSEILDGTIGTGDLANSIITSAKIADGTIAAADLSQMGAVSGQVMQWNGSVWVATTQSGTISGLTTNKVPKAGSSSTLTDGSMTDTGTSVTVTTSGQNPMIWTGGLHANPTVRAANASGNAGIILENSVDADKSYNARREADGTFILGYSSAYPYGSDTDTLLMYDPATDRVRIEETIVRDAAANVLDAIGTGSPESAVTAGIGSTFRRKNGGTASTLYVKESGTGNTGWVAIGSGGGVTDGDKGDITVSSSGATWTVDNSAITYAKIQNASANTIIGRAAATSGAVAEISVASSRLVGRAATGDIAALSLGAGLSFSGTTIKTANTDSLYAVSNTLYLRGTNGNTTSVTITVSFPRDTMWLSGNDLKFAPEGNTSLVQTITLPAPVSTPVTTSSGSTITANLTSTNVHIIDATSIDAPTITTSNNQNGKWHKFHIKNNNDSLYFSPSKFQYTLENGNTCPLDWVNTSNFILSGYSDASMVWIDGSTTPLSCYPFENEYQAVIDYARTQGYTLPSNQTQIYQNALLDSMKVNGIWDSLDVFYIVTGDANTEDFTKINWKDPTGDDNLTEVGTCTYAATGWNGDGSTSALNTNWNPSSEGVNYSLNDASFGAWIVSPGGTGSKYNMGVQVSGGTTRMEENSGGRKFIINASGETTTTGGATTGLWHINRSASGTTAGYLNGSLQTSDTDLSTSVSNGNLYLMSLNLSNSAFGSTVSTVKYKMWFAGGNLASKASKFYTLINTYVSSI